MKILGIETSCDETAICLIDANEQDGTVRILGNAVHSQIPEHIPYGGVFPMLAKREHEKNLPIVLERCLTEAKATQEDIDLVAVTVGPGLEPALWTGIVFAKNLATQWNKKIVPCNHMEGHILTALIEKNEEMYEIKVPALPALSLLISGGHTQIVLVEKPGSYKIVGETKDDAIGECFDKIARTLGLAYPGGPKISKLAAEARAAHIASPEPLPRPMIASKSLDFSFSGLKTAVLYLVQRLRENGSFNDDVIKGICREAEDAMTDVVVSKMRQAIETYAAQTIITGGGVIANGFIREHLKKLADDSSIPLLLPQFDHSTDNGLMIALAGFVNRNKAVPADTHLKATGTLPLGPRV
ncbi:MAG TPA: tRNA (adenosine(37)-N6)-threonylcarbamoyltransferase complex transferase subunit TsaD [Candidatus Paceibacterota bacterium]|jgi:putative glycoprotease GCP